MDSLARDYASWSTYNYVLGNPVMFVDPDGRSADWIPELDDDNNLILRAEEGDNFSTLKDFLGRDENREYFGFSVGELWTKHQEGKAGGIVNLGNDNAVSKANATIASFTGDQTTNCFECALDIARGADLSIGSEKNFRETSFDYNGAYGAAINHTLVDAGSIENLKFGQSVITFGTESWRDWLSGDSPVDHVATYLGTSRAGTTYLFSKNGALQNSDHGIFKTEELTRIYGPVTGWNEGDSGYYNLRR